MIPISEEGEIDVDELGLRLKQRIEQTQPGSSERGALFENANYRKCVRIYDFLRYKKASQSSPSVHILLINT